MYREGNWTALRLVTFPISDDEIKFAMEMNEHDSNSLLSGLRMVEENFSSLINVEDLSVESVCNGEQVSSDLQPLLPNMSCVGCGLTDAPEVWSEEAADLLGLPEEPVDHRIKSIKDKLQRGLDIEYRCVKCRDCTSCKNAEQ